MAGLMNPKQSCRMVARAVHLEMLGDETRYEAEVIDGDAPCWETEYTVQRFQVSEAVGKQLVAHFNGAPRPSPTLDELLAAGA